MSIFEIIMSAFFLIASVAVLTSVVSQEHEQKRGGIGGQMLVSDSMETNKKRITTQKTVLNRITIGCGVFIVIALVAYYAMQ